MKSTAIVCANGKEQMRFADALTRKINTIVGKNIQCQCDYKYFFFIKNAVRFYYYF